MLNQSENDNCNEEAKHQKLKSTFTKENLLNLRARKGKHMFEHLQSNAYLYGFKQCTKQVHNDSFIALQTYYSKSNNLISDNCNFEFNLQVHNYD